MFGKVVFWAIFFGAFGVLAWQIYDNIPRAPVSLITEKMEKKVVLIDYGDTPVFAKNLRFNHNDITYFISPSCSEKKKRKMNLAFKIFESKFKNITFTPSDENSADILVECSEKKVQHSDSTFTAGEGGPYRIIDTGGFNLIELGRVFLYKEISECEYPVVELHELLHVFGFDHSKNPKSIMYNISRCDQRITDDMVRILNNLYMLPALPDLKIQNLSAIQRGRYLDFNITVTNIGLLESPAFRLSITHKGQEVEGFNLDGIGPGVGRTVQATNVYLPSRNIKSISFIVDKENKIKEFNEKNNIVRMRKRE